MSFDVANQNHMFMSCLYYLFLAETVFREVGKELQWRRNYDFEELFGCHLTDNFDPTQDPAEQDEELRKVLTDSYQKFEASVSKVSFNVCLDFM